MISHSETPLFTVIVPLYNAGFYIRDCVDSLVNQSYQDFEIIIVDDGSTDDGLSTAQGIAEESSCAIKVLRQEHLGPYMARLEGISKAEGEYLLFCDSDDTLRGDALEVLAQVIERCDADVVLFRMCRRKDYSEDKATRFFSLSEQDTNAISLDAVKRALLRTDSINNLASKCFRRRCFSGLTRDDKRKHLVMGEDKLAVCHAISRASSCAAIDDILYYYRINPASTTAHGYDPARLESVFVVRSCMEKYLSQWGMESERKALNALFVSQLGDELLDLSLRQMGHENELSVFRRVSEDDVFQNACICIDWAQVSLWRRMVMRPVSRGNFRMAMGAAYACARLRSCARMVLGMRSGAS